MPCATSNLILRPPRKQASHSRQDVFILWNGSVVPASIIVMIYRRNHIDFFCNTSISFLPSVPWPAFTVINPHPLHIYYALLCTQYAFTLHPLRTHISSVHMYACVFSIYYILLDNYWHFGQHCSRNGCRCLVGDVLVASITIMKKSYLLLLERPGYQDVLAKLCIN